MKKILETAERIGAMHITETNEHWLDKGSIIFDNVMQLKEFIFTFNQQQGKL